MTRDKRRWRWFLWLGVFGIPLLIVSAWLARRVDPNPGSAAVVAPPLLPPPVRIEKFKEARAEYAAVEPKPDDTRTGTIQGTIHAPDGGELQGKIEASSLSRWANGTYGKGLGTIKPTFSVEVNPGSVWLWLDPENYAPKVVGPRNVRPGETIEGLDVTLEPGYSALVKVIDERGAPVAGASLNGGLHVEGGMMGSSPRGVTDADGLLTIAHAATAPYSIAATAPGFQKARSITTRLSPQTPTILRLVHAHPASGVVVSPDGRPVAGATIRKLASFQPSSTNHHGDWEPPIATTDAEGRFQINAFDDDCTYAVLIESAKLGRSVVAGVKAGQANLTWTVGPRLSLRGTIRGSLSRLKTEGGKPTVEITQSGRGTITDVMNTDWRPRLTKHVSVEPTDGGGRFSLEGVLPGEVIVKAAERVAKLDVEATATDHQVTIDLNEAPPHPSTRRVIIGLVTEGATRATGSIVAQVSSIDGTPNSRTLDLPIVRGEVSFEMPVPGQFFYTSRSVVGYWFEDDTVEVPVGEGPLEVEVTTLPAVAIVGRVVEPDGKTPAASNVQMSIHTVERSKAMKNGQFVRLNNIAVDADGRFFLGPLPIGGTYAAVASRGHNAQASAPIRLDGSKAIERVELRLTPTVEAGGQVVGPDGQALAGVPVTLHREHAFAGTSWSPPTLTDSDGRFRFDELSTVVGVYRVEVDAHKDYEPADAVLDRNGRDVEIRLQRGHVIHGRVLDAATGRPIPGVEMYAARLGGPNEARRPFEPEGKTDAQGRFRFSNLAPGRYQVNDRSGLQWQSPTMREAAADQPGAIEIQATLPSWSTLKVAP